MRIVPIAIVAVVGLALSTAQSPAGSSSQPGRSFSIARPAPLPAAFTPVPLDGGDARAMPAQLPRCYPPGSRVCVSGWLRICTCYSFGCHWAPTSYRC